MSYPIFCAIDPGEAYEKVCDKQPKEFVGGQPGGGYLTPAGSGAAGPRGASEVGAERRRRRRGRRPRPKRNRNRKRKKHGIELRNL